MWIEILEIEVDINHVHVIASLSLTMSLSYALNLMKGLSTYLLFKFVPNLRKRYRKGHFWSPRNFVASVGHITLENAKKYLVEHRVKCFAVGIPACGTQWSKLPKATIYGVGGRQSLSYIPS